MDIKVLAKINCQKEFSGEWIGKSRVVKVALGSRYCQLELAAI